jgi:hypothetical protein
MAANLNHVLEKVAKEQKSLLLIGPPGVGEHHQVNWRFPVENTANRLLQILP